MEFTQLREPLTLDPATRRHSLLSDSTTATANSIINLIASTSCANWHRRGRYSSWHLTRGRLILRDCPAECSSKRIAAFRAIIGNVHESFHLQVFVSFC